MQNSEWFKKFSFLIIIIILFMLLYGVINLKIMSLEKEKSALKDELEYLEGKLDELTIKYEEVTNPKNLIERAVEELKVKYDKGKVIIIDKGESSEKESQDQR
ncbi:MAG TPA: hypothetical protein P5272_04745 [Caldisericia bacterium]|nr:hypothetical protein [Caldisericia bacterium]HOL83014.1 hypothetical protein [Caldisericia bacterium]HON83725.1 hypothetical protein [Caldisericia bacterium]HPC56914.1 hypothetical protein [Caldisericia bacterium]HPP43546.1 hypothetical protein [Caldisericia bacterium]